MTIKQVNLNPIEATAYFWVETVKNKIKEIYLKDNKQDVELRFLNIFYNFSDVEWRKLYLELSFYLNNKVNNYVPHGLYGIDAYSQDTEKYYHQDINKVLNFVSRNNVPDIGLSSDLIEDSIISTNIYGANRYYKSGGVVSLDTCFNYNYILTGDKRELDLKYLLISIITVICQNNKNYSVNDLKKIFKSIYFDMYNDLDAKIIDEDFERIFNLIHDEGLVNGLSCDKEFSSKIERIDLVGTNNYNDIVKMKLLRH